MRILDFFRASSPARAWTRMAFQPIKDMGKDYLDTAKPYRSGFAGWHFLRDFLQPVLGLAYIGGAMLLATAPLFLLARLFINTFSPSTFKQNMLRDLQITGIALLAAVTTAIRGFTMLFSTPLTYIFKIPFRSYLTAKAIEADTLPTFEQSAGLLRDLEILRKAIENANPLNTEATTQKGQATAAIMTKFRIALAKGVRTTLKEKEVEDAFANITPCARHKHFDEALNETGNLESLFKLNQIADKSASKDTTGFYNLFQKVTGAERVNTINDTVNRAVEGLDNLLLGTPKTQQTGRRPGKSKG